jgi:hypothetical protein
MSFPLIYFSCFPRMRVNNSKILEVAIIWKGHRLNMLFPLFLG